MLLKSCVILLMIIACIAKAQPFKPPFSYFCNGRLCLPSRNEECTECGSLCPEKCKKTPLRVCPAVCVGGCFCRQGYVFDEWGSCVLPSKCRCTKRNERYADSGPAGECLPTCTNPKPINCTDVDTTPGCFCQQDFVLNNRFECVAVSDCPKPVPIVDPPPPKTK